MNPITVEEYFAGYEKDPDATPERRANAAALLVKVNALMAEAETDGVYFAVNPYTGCHVSGTGHGAFRNQACRIGAPGSTHKQGKGVDIYDPHRDFARWCMKHLNRLAARGLHMEDPHWTPTWTHLQDLAPGHPPVPEKIVYIPSNDPPAYTGTV